MIWKKDSEKILFDVHKGADIGTLNQLIKIAFNNNKIQRWLPWRDQLF